MGAFSLILGSSVVIGPIIGGAITQSRLGWHWLFWINLPIIGLVLLLVLGVTYTGGPDLRGENYGLKFREKLRLLDWIGTSLLALTLVPLILALDFGQTYGWKNPRSAVMLAVSGVSLVLLLLQQRVAKEAIFERAILLNRSVWTTTGIFSCALSSVSVIILFLPFLSNLLQALRKELEAVLTTKVTPQGRQAELDIGRAEVECPLLHACYQEALRIGSTPTCNRAVLEDVVLTDPDTGREILFKKGWRVSIPTFLLHNRDTFWGGNAESFGPEKLLPGGIATDSKGKVKTQGFVPYGGGAHLCPGRHLAKMEILASGALVIMALDFESENGFVTQNYALNAGAKKPLGLDNVRIRRRMGWEDIGWSVKI